MPYPDYPTDRELADFLVNAGFGGATESDVRGMASAAAVEWERATGWRPFRADDLAATYAYDPPTHGLWLELGTAFLTITQVKVNVTHDDPTGVTLVEGRDYLLETSQGVVQRLRFDTAFCRSPKSVRVTGRRGYCIDLPDDVFVAILARAASNASPSVQGSPGPVKRVEQGPVRYEYALEAGRAQTDRWDQQFARAVARYQRITL